MAALVILAPLLPSLALAQRPTPEQAAQILQSRPDLVAILRQRVGSSGLTPDQIRARLRAEGYPESLLDTYLPGSTGAVSDSMLTPDVFAAVRQLGITDSTDAETLRRMQMSLAPDTSGLASDELTIDPLTGLPSRRLSELDRLLRASRTDSLMLLDRRQTRPDSGHRIFGLEMFRTNNRLFDPSTAGPVDASYRVGPGDRLVLILTGDVEQAYTLDVTREGFVVIPQVGQLHIAGLTMGQIEDLLYSRLGRAYSGVRRGPGATTRFALSVARLRSIQVYVMGDVLRPSSYRQSSTGTAMTALYQASGPNQNGSLRRIEIRRGGRTVDTLDVYDYLLRGDATNDPRLENGDIVFVPVHGARVRIWGEVNRPATYELKGGETLADVITAAGGLTPEASAQRIQIERIIPPQLRTAAGSEREFIDVSSSSGSNGLGRAIRLEDGDVVRVFPVTSRVRNRIVVEGGGVWQPGAQGLRPGMRLSDALRGAGGVRPDVFLGRVLISRLKPDSTRVELRAMLRDTTGAVVDDPVLQEDDIISVFTLSEFTPERFVSVTGAVRNPGAYEYREGMTARDLVLRAGGLLQSALLTEAEVARMPDFASRQRGVTATTMRVPLDSTYLFERGPDGRYLGPPGVPAPSGGAPEIPLLPYDNLLIKQQPDWELQRTVSVTGQVRSPGRYALTTKTQRLSDLIAHVGGLTTEAYPEGVYFYRSRDRVGRIGIDLPTVLKNPRHEDNLILQDGDSIVVPMYNAVVTVTGAVNSPVAVPYVRGENLQFYIRSAGGPSRKADEPRAYVTQPNGKVESIARRLFFFDGMPEPRAGSVVHVPEKDPSERRDYVAIAAAGAQLLGALVTVILATRK